MRSKHAWPFLEPVDPVALELDDYFEVPYPSVVLISRTFFADSVRRRSSRSRWILVRYKCSFYHV